MANKVDCTLDSNKYYSALGMWSISNVLQHKWYFLARRLEIWKLSFHVELVHAKNLVVS
jgi:hypothetical protein